MTRNATASKPASSTRTPVRAVPSRCTPSWARAPICPGSSRFQLVNRYVNRKGYRYDRRKTTHSDEGKVVRISHWKTLWEFMESGGDCEDYATTKYFLLRRLGFSPENLRVVVVYDRRYRAHHAVVAIRFDAENTWLLETDNHIYRRHKPAEYRYVYAVNELGIWDHDVRVPKKR